MAYTLQNISVTFGNWAMKNLSLEIPEGKFVSIVGPSGCGKTTLLKILAGLEQPSAGRVFFGSNDVTNVPAEERGVGFVFQNDALFSHMDVFHNVAFGLEMRKEKDLQKKVSAALELVHLSGFEKRKIPGLSGGERRRAAIARAIAFSPKLLLLDEPLNGLDANLRESMKSLLKEVQVKTGATVVMVTHDIDEAFPLSDLTVVMGNGSIEQTGKPEEIFRRPASPFVRDFVSDYLLAEAKAPVHGAKGRVQLSIPLPGKKRGKKFSAILKRRNFRFG